MRENVEDVALLPRSSRGSRSPSHGPRSTRGLFLSGSVRRRARLPDTIPAPGPTRGPSRQPPSASRSGHASNSLRVITRKSAPALAPGPRWCWSRRRRRRSPRSRSRCSRRRRASPRHVLARHRQGRADRREDDLDPLVRSSASRARPDREAADGPVRAEREEGLARARRQRAVHRLRRRRSRPGGRGGDAVQVPQLRARPASRRTGSSSRRASSTPSSSGSSRPPPG